MERQPAFQLIGRPNLMLPSSRALASGRSLRCHGPTRCVSHCTASRGETAPGRINTSAGCHYPIRSRRTGEASGSFFSSLGSAHANLNRYPGKLGDQLDLAERETLAEVFFPLWVQLMQTLIDTPALCDSAPDRHDPIRSRRAGDASGSILPSLSVAPGAAITSQVSDALDFSHLVSFSNASHP